MSCLRKFLAFIALFVVSLGCARDDDLASPVARDQSVVETVVGEAAKIEWESLSPAERDRQVRNIQRVQIEQGSPYPPLSIATVDGALPDGSTFTVVSDPESSGVIVVIPASSKHEKGIRSVLEQMDKQGFNVSAYTLVSNLNEADMRTVHVEGIGVVSRMSH